MTEPDAPGFAFRMLLGDTVPAVFRGPADGPIVLILQPLFEEMNRCRRFLADLGAALAGNGIASVLPDLPGQGDNPAAGGFDASAWDETVGSIAAALGRPAYIAAMRGGCLLRGTADAAGRYHIAPATGAALLRDMMRAQAFADMEATGIRTEVAAYADRLDAGGAVALTGYAVGSALYRSLSVRTPVEPGVETLDFAGPPLWRQADPVRVRDEAARLARLIAARINT